MSSDSGNSPGTGPTALHPGGATPSGIEHCFAPSPSRLAYSSQTNVGSADKSRAAVRRRRPTDNYDTSAESSASEAESVGSSTDSSDCESRRSSAVPVPWPHEEKPYNLIQCLPEALDLRLDPSLPVLDKFSEDHVYAVRAGQLSFTKRCPHGWIRVTHPGGRPYFWNERHNVVTDGWMLDNAVFDCVNGTLARIVDRLKNWREVDPLPREYHIVISPRKAFEGNTSTSRYEAYYYLAAPRHESIFWLETWNINWFLQESQAQLEDHTVGLFLKYQFYKHWDNFPDIQKLTTRQIRRMQLTVDNALADVTFSKTSTINYSADRLDSMKGMLDRLLSRHERSEKASQGRKERRMQGRTREGRKELRKLDPTVEGEWLPGRMMQQIYHDQFLNLYGQHGARVDRLQSVFGKHPDFARQSWFIMIFGALLFMAPCHHLDELNRMWVDRTLARGVWKKRVGILLGEWAQQRVLVSCALCLCVPFIDNLPDGISKISCFLSAISSSASFVLITVLERRISRIEKNVELGASQKWLLRMNNERIGLEILAVLLGLPYGFTFWSIIFFCVAFLSYCLRDVTSSTGMTVSAFFGVHIAVVFWALWISLEDRKSIQEHGQVVQGAFSRVAEIAQDGIGAAAGAAHWMVSAARRGRSQVSLERRADD
ncbi:hypothetical protein HDZ31DRAFT_79381 [Schizophyllum fasciatum]